jgi:hypothetical protein
MAGTVIVIKRKGQFLKMIKKVPPHIRLNIGAHSVSPIGYKIGKGGAEDIQGNHKAHHNKKETVQICGEQFFYRVFGHHGEHHIGPRDQGGAKHIRRKEFPVGTVVGSEYGNYRPVKAMFISHAFFLLYRFFIPADRGRNSLY